MGGWFLYSSNVAFEKILSCLCVDLRVDKAWVNRTIRRLKRKGINTYKKYLDIFYIITYCVESFKRK